MGIQTDQCRLLKSTGISLLLKVELTHEETTSYEADFDCNDLTGTEGYTIAELDGKNTDGNGTELKFSVKMSYDNFDKVLTHKMTELEQIEGQVQELGASIKGVVSGKSANAREEQPRHAQNEGEDSGGVPSGSKSLTAVVQTATIVAAVLVEYRSFWLFGVSAVGIFLYGDYASI